MMHELLYDSADLTALLPQYDCRLPIFTSSLQLGTHLLLDLSISSLRLQLDLQLKALGSMQRVL